MKTPPFPIVFETRNMIIIDKPAGTLSVPSRMGKADPRRCVGIELQEYLGHQIWPVHRLDFEVSGLLIFAKTEKAHQRLSRVFESRKITKIYEAYAEMPEGAARPPVFQKWESLLQKGKKRTFEAPYGKPALTEAKFTGMTEWNGMSLGRWELSPLTGRSHQLRYEMAKHGFPILGDLLYGSVVRDFKLHGSGSRIALHAFVLRFRSRSLRLHGLFSL